MALAVTAGLAAFVVDALFDFLSFYKGSFLDVLLFDLSPREIYFRCVLLLLFVGFGLVQIRFISGRERTERPLRENEENFRVLFQAAPIGLGVTNMDGNLIAFNEAILKPGGYTAEDMTSIETVADLYYDSDDLEKTKRLSSFCNNRDSCGSLK